MDLELSYRFVDWFSHHLSNFGFTWKWAEWSEDAQLPDLSPRKWFLKGALDKEIRLSFAQRIQKTLPEPYLPLIGSDKEKDVPDFKYRNPGKSRRLWSVNNLPLTYCTRYPVCQGGPGDCDLAETQGTLTRISSL